MATKTQQIDVAKVPEFLRAVARVTEPVDIVREGEIVGRVVPPGELSEAEKEEILRRGREVVQEARARNKSVPEREIGKVVDAAVKRVRSRK